LYLLGNDVAKKGCDVIDCERGGRRMENQLVETDEFNGRYVALKSFEDHTAVGVGDDPESAFKDARAKGVEAPVLIFVTEKDTVHIYSYNLLCHNIQDTNVIKLVIVVY
jgi:hypothetical protein